MRIEIELLRRQIEAGERQIKRYRDAIARTAARGRTSSAVSEHLEPLERVVRANRLRLYRMMARRDRTSTNWTRDGALVA